MKVKCHFCNKEVDTDVSLTSQAVSGWERRRDQGGTNAVILREVHERWACYTCIENLRNGRSIGQERLLP